MPEIGYKPPSVFLMELYPVNYFVPVNVPQAAMQVFALAA
jgi:hypothetical protein